MKNPYNKDYYEEGVAKGVSGYTNYSWQPELTIPLAHRLTRRLLLTPNTRVLDFGCAKGFLVKALRLLDVPAFGCDVSEYAISKVDPDYKDFVWAGGIKGIYHTIVAKDVFEHLSKKELNKVLKAARKSAERLFFVVPMGENGKYVIPQYENDVTHVIREDALWWTKAASNAGWDVLSWSYNMDGLKDSWAHYPTGNAWFYCV